jgi:hypothetical protein
LDRLVNHLVVVETLVQREFQLFHLFAFELRWERLRLLVSLVTHLLAAGVMTATELGLLVLLVFEGSRWSCCHWQPWRAVAMLAKDWHLQLLV